MALDQIVLQVARLLRERPADLQTQYGRLIDDLTPAERAKVIRGANAIVTARQLAMDRQLPGTVRELLRQSGWDYETEGRSPTGNLDAGYRVKVRIDLPGGGSRFRTIRDDVSPDSSLQEIWDLINTVVTAWSVLYPGTNATILTDTLEIF